MAISVSGIFNTNNDVTWSGTSSTSGSFTTVNNSLLVVLVAMQTNVGSFTPANFRISGGSLTWDNSAAPILSRNSTSGANSNAFAVFSAPVTTGASGVTVTVSSLPTGSSNERLCFQVFSITGYNTSTHTGATATGTSTTAGAISITLSSAPASSSAILAGLNFSPNGSGGTTTAGSGWTQIYDLSAPGSGTLCVQSQWITGQTSTTVPWQAQVVGDTSLVSVQWAIEFLVAGGATPPESGEDPWFRPEVLKFGVKGKTRDNWASFPLNVPPTTPPPPPLKPFDQWPTLWSKGAPVEQRCESWQFEFLPSPLPPQPYGEFDQWQSAGKPTKPGPDFTLDGGDAFVTTGAVKLIEFDQWPTIWSGGSPAPDWSGFEYVTPSAAPQQPISEFDTWQNRVQVRKPSADFTTDQATNQYVTPATPVLSEFDRWTRALAPRITLTPFASSPQPPRLSAPLLLYTLEAQQLATGVTSFTTGSFTPPSNCLIVACVNFFENYTGTTADNPANLSMSGGGLTWTNRTAADIANGNNPRESGLAIFTAPVTTGASMTATVSGFGSAMSLGIGAGIELFTVTGYDTVTPIGATATGTNTSTGAVTITLSGAPASTSYVIGVKNTNTVNGVGVATPGAGWTELYSTVSLNHGYSIEIEYITGTTSTSVSWAGMVNNGDSVFNGCQVQSAFEIRAAGGPTPTIYAFEEIWPPQAGPTVPGLAARRDFWEFARIDQVAAPPQQPLEEFDPWASPQSQRLAKIDFQGFEYLTLAAPVQQIYGEFDQWSIAQRKALSAADWAFGPQIPGAATTPYLGQYDQWVAAQKQRLIAGDLQSFVTTPPPSFQGAFVQWADPVRLRLPLPQDWPQLAFVAPQAVTVTLLEFDQFQNKTQLWKPGADFTTDQAINQYVTPATPVLSEYDRWAMAFAPKVTQTPFTDFTFVPPAVVQQVLQEFDQWALVQKIKLVQTETVGFEFVPPVTVTTPALAEFDQWVSAQRQRLATGDFQGFAAAPSVTILNEFDQWSALQRASLARGDFSAFEYLSPRASGTPIETFDQWSASIRQRLVQGDFASFVQTPLAQAINSFEFWWQKAKTPLVVGQGFTGFVFIPPAVVAQPLLQFDQWQPNWHNLQTPISQKDQFWQFGRLDQPPAPVAQPLRQFDQWQPQRTTTTTGRDFTSFVGAPPSTTTTTASDPFVWVKKKKKQLTPVVIDPKKSKQRKEQAPPQKPIPEKKRKKKTEEARLPKPIPKLLPEPLVPPTGLVPLPPATLPAHIFNAPQWTLPQAVTSPPPFRMATPEEIDMDDEDVLNLILEEMQQIGEL